MTKRQCSTLHAMVDIETLSTNKDAHILSVGIFPFIKVLTKQLDEDRFTTSFDTSSFAITSLEEELTKNRSFYKAFSPIGQEKRHTSDSTREFWVEQRQAGGEALKVFKEIEDLVNKQEHVLESIKVLTSYVDGLVSEYDVDHLFIWGNGAAFDNAVLASLLEQNDVKTPWSYKCDMCYRTIMTVFGPTDLNLLIPTFETVPHNALSDAMYQSEMLLQNFETRFFGLINHKLLAKS